MSEITHSERVSYSIEAGVAATILEIGNNSFTDGHRTMVQALIFFNTAFSDVGAVEILKIMKRTRTPEELQLIAENLTVAARVAKSLTNSVSLVRSEQRRSPWKISVTEGCRNE